jgi:hypothetical protein
MTTTSPSYRGDVGRDYGTDRQPRFRSFTETKAFYKTSEFIVWLISAAAILVVTYQDGNDSLSSWHGWLLVAILSAAYMFSRGIAKSGSREPYTRDND